VGDLHFAARFRQRALAAELEAGHAVRASSLASLAEDAARAAEWRLADQFSAAASAAPSNRARAQVSIVRALSCTAEGNSTSAVHHLRRALRLLYDHGDRARCADVLIMLACQYERRQNYRKAASTFHRAARTFRRLDNTPAARHAAQRRAVAHRSASILQHAAECN
jgi:tetratricopeptide (TPR) repeat protein